MSSRHAVIFIPTLTAGGAERVATLLANTWTRYPGVRVSLVLLFDEAHFYSLDTGVETASLGLKPNASAVRKAFALVRGMFALRRAVTRLQPDFVLSFMNKYNAYCIISLLGSAIPVIAAERDSPTEILPRSRVVIRDFAYRFAAKILVQSQLAKDFMGRRNPGRPVKVLQNPVSASLIPDRRRPAKVILNVARMFPVKGHADLLDAFKIAALDGWTLRICGEGPERPRLEARIDELGIGNDVELPGNISDLRSEYASAGMFVFPSYREGFPNALAEALAAGIPCISYDCPTGPADIIDHGVNGFLVPMGDVKQLASYIRGVAGDEELAISLGSAARRLGETLRQDVVAARYWEACLAAVGTNLRS